MNSWSKTLLSCASSCLLFRQLEMLHVALIHSCIHILTGVHDMRLVLYLLRATYHGYHIGGLHTLSCLPRGEPCMVVIPVGAGWPQAVPDLLYRVPALHVSTSPNRIIFRRFASS